MSARLVVLLVSVAAVLALSLAVVSRATRIGSPEGAPGDPEPALEAVSRALQDALRAAGTGLPAGAEAVRVLHPSERPRDEKGAPLPLRPGSHALVVRGVLTSPWVALDARDRATGAPYAGEAGNFAATPARARLSIPVYPLALNPRVVWISPPEGLGRAFGKERSASASPGRRNEPLEPILSALAERPAAARRFLLSDARGRVASARVVEADGAAVGFGCTCVAPAPWPGDCPPGRAGCRLDLVLDFAVEPPRDGFVPPGSLGPLTAGGLLDELLFCVVEGERPWLARGRADGSGGWALARIGEDVEALSVRLSGGPARVISVDVSVRGAASARRSATVSVALPPS